MTAVSAGQTCGGCNEQVCWEWEEQWIRTVLDTGVPPKAGGMSIPAGRHLAH